MLKRILVVLIVVAATSCSQSNRPPEITLFYGSELFGSIDGCGCLGNPRLGGLPYRMGYTAEFRSEHPAAPLLQLDAGASMKPIVNAEGKVVDEWIAENDAVLEALDAFNYDALNLTDIDAPYLARRLGAASKPAVLERYVSANIEPASAAVSSPKPFLVRSVGGYRVAITGVSQPNAGLEKACGMRVSDAAAALERVLPEMRSSADAVIVMVYMPAASSAALRERFPGRADLWIVANSIGGDAPPPGLDGPDRFTYSWYKTQQLGVLTLTFEGKRVTSARNAYVKMDDPISRDARAEELAAASKAKVREIKERRFAASGQP